MTDREKNESNERLARIEANLAALSDAQLVTQRLLELHGRQANERFARLEAKSESHEDGVAELRGAMTSLIANIDRFIQGQQHNGH